MVNPPKPQYITVSCLDSDGFLDLHHRYREHYWEYKAIEGLDLVVLDPDTHRPITFPITTESAVDSESEDEPDTEESSTEGETESDSE